MNVLGIVVINVTIKVQPKKTLQYTSSPSMKVLGMVVINVTIRVETKETLKTQAVQV